MAYGKTFTFASLRLLTFIISNQMVKN